MGVLKKVLILGKIADAGLSLLKRKKKLQVIQLLNEAATDEKQILYHLKNCNALLVRTQKIKAEWLEDATKLEIISRHGVGLDNLPLEIIKKKKISLKTVGDVNSIAVAEHIISLMLSCAKKTFQYFEAAKTGNWSIRDSAQSSELYGKNLLLLGCGKVGSQVLKRLQGFGMHFFVYDPYLSKKQIVSNETSYEAEKIVQLDVENLGIADFILICCPKTEETRNMIDSKQLARIKKTAILINSARGGIVNEDALFSALKEKKIAFAGLDVFAEEPLKKTSKLWQLENIIITPHSASKTKECMLRTSVRAVENIIDFFG